MLLLHLGNRVFVPFAPENRLDRDIFRQKRNCHDNYRGGRQAYKHCVISQERELGKHGSGHNACPGAQGVILLLHRLISVFSPFRSFHTRPMQSKGAIPAPAME